MNPIAQSHRAVAEFRHLSLCSDYPMAWNHGVEIQLQRAVECLRPFFGAATAGIVDQLRCGVAESEHVSGSERPLRGEVNDNVAVGMGAAEVIHLHILAAKVDMRMLLECDVGQSRLFPFHHVLASLLRRYNQDAHLLQFRISSAMVGMVM